MQTAKLKLKCHCHVCLSFLLCVCGAEGEVFDARLLTDIECRQALEHTQAGRPDGYQRCANDGLAEAGRV